MTTALVYLVFMLLVAAVVFLLAAMVFGRGEELAPLPPGASPTRLPASDLSGEDIAAVRFQLVLRGYKMSEVDWVMQRLGAEVDALRARIAELESASGDAPPDAAPDPAGPGPAEAAQDAPGTRPHLPEGEPPAAAEVREQPPEAASVAEEERR